MLPNRDLKGPSAPLFQNNYETVAELGPDQFKSKHGDRGAGDGPLERHMAREGSYLKHSHDGRCKGVEVCGRRTALKVKSVCEREREREREEGKLLEEVTQNTSCLFELLLCDDKFN